MTLVNALYSLAVGLLFGIVLYALAWMFPATRPVLVLCWRMSPACTIMGCLMTGLMASFLFLLCGWWVLVVWLLVVVASHLVVEVKRQLDKKIPPQQVS